LQVLRTRLYNMQRQQADSERTEARRKQVSSFSKTKCEKSISSPEFSQLGRAGKSLGSRLVTYVLRHFQ